MMDARAGERHDCAMAATLDIDAAVRLLAGGQLLLIGLVVGRSETPRALRAATIALMLAVAAYLVNASPAILAPASAWRYPAQLLAQSVPLLLWLFAHLLFERPLPRVAAALAAAITLATFLLFFMGTAAGRWGNIVQHGLAILLTVHALWVAWAGRGDDLVESRRRIRVGFVGVIGVQALAVILVELGTGFAPASPVLMLLQSGSSLVIIALVGLVLLTADADLLASAAPATVPAARLTAAETVLKDQLDAAMAAGAWARPGLGIGGLAADLGVPDHRLRTLINRRLGYRNFAAFLNDHRIAAARQRLADPALVSLPVLSIAMDLGYGSLAPFNRAFRDATGTTPTAYRQQALARG